VLLVIDPIDTVSTQSCLRTIESKNVFPLSVEFYRNVNDSVRQKYKAVHEHSYLYI
jgi:hypothetical protein